MNLLTIGIGFLPCIYAIFMLRVRLKGIDKYFTKLEPMKKRFGKNAGSLIHYFSYVLMPFSFGVFIMYFGFLGVNIFDF